MILSAVDLPPFVNLRLLMLSLRSCNENILPAPSPSPSGSDPDSELEAPYGVRIYLPHALFAYLVERAGRQGESLSGFIVELLFKEYDSRRH